MNVNLRIQLLKRQIETNLDLISDKSLSNEKFCDLAEVNRIRMNELTSLYRTKNEEVDKRINEFRRNVM